MTVVGTPNSKLLEKAQALIAIERSLTATLEKVEPWLTSNNTPKTTLSSQGQHHFSKRVRPIPTTMDQVEKVLAVSRNFASRTSAPAGWNPMAPVVGFSTPNPLPHQLRGGALAALQLERARQAEEDKKRRRQEVEEEAKKEAKARLMDNHQQQSGGGGGGEGVGGGGDGSDGITPKISNQQHGPTAHRAGGAAPPPGGNAAARPRTNPRPQQTVLATTMNLSDSSSSDGDDNDDDSD
jgi:hypothetical protein